MFNQKPISMTTKKTTPQHIGTQQSRVLFELFFHTCHTLSTNTKKLTHKNTKTMQKRIKKNSKRMNTTLCSNK